MKLPNLDRAVVDIVKLRAYCLNAGHPRGRHKARVFAAALGMSAADAQELQALLLSAAKHTKPRRGQRIDMERDSRLTFRSSGRSAKQW
jgi:ribosome-binding factor A